MTTDVEVYEAPPPATLFGTDDPAAVVARATAAAVPLAEVVNKRGLYHIISGKKHVLVEGWTLLGSMLGVFPVTEWTRKTETGWEARVLAKTKHGEIVGAAEASCDRDERNWKNRDDYALRSMAQTRATSKALRQPLGFVMTLAGYAATPAEEMPRETIEDAELVSDPDGNVFPDQRPIDEPSPYQPPEGATDKPKGTITDAQLRMLHRLEKKLDAAAVRAGLELQYGTTHFSELSKEQASQVITDLKQQAGE